MKEKSSIKAKGKVRIEKMRDGKIVDVYEKDNLVVDTASDVITKSMSGDPRDILWKSPYLTDDYLNTYPSQNVEPTEGPKGYMWEYTYEPKFIYKRRYGSGYRYEKSSYPDELINYFAGRTVSGFDVFKLPEMHSTDVINFVGIGSGTHYYFDAIDKIFSLNGTGWSKTFATPNKTYKGGVFTSSENVGDSIEFKSKANEISIYLQGEPSEFGEVIVKIDDIQYTNILDMQKEDPELEKIDVINTATTNLSFDSGTLEYKIENLSDEEKKIEIELTSGIIKFLGVEQNEVGKTLTTLNKEIPVETKKINVFEEYFVDNETKTFELNKRGSEIVLDSVKIFNNSNEFASDITGALREPNPGDWEYKLELDPTTNKPTGLVFLSEPVDSVNVKYEVEADFDTEYKRAAISKPKEGQDYPHYNYTHKKVVYEAKFEENNPNYPIEVKELALFNKPLPRDIAAGSITHPEKMFSIARIDGYKKKPKEALRIVWEITFG